ncbi:MAG: YkgJ family cysteine cluster protein [Spirochaetales bacterium]|nr:YkgJ family cysteine cluster protein [Spirochaetales bacterium]MBR6348546.1 YkgJ family cysteine cluster protein [Spirochaetales bacterium]
MGACFYDKGLRFECQNCNYCCSSEPGYVFLSEEDISRLSSGLGMEAQAFIDTFCRIVDMGAFKMVSLLEKENYDCIFLENGGCRVYEHRPRQCETYPFWAHVLEDRESWDREAQSCPGMNKGKLYTKKEIEEKLSDRLGNNPVIIM